MVVLAAAGGGLLLGCRLDGPPGAASAKSAAAAGPPAFAPNAFVRVGTDDMVTVILPQAEMGQGVYTALPMLVAEELEIGLDQVRVEHAPGDDRLYANPLLGFQATGGSTSTRAFYEPMRQAGAAARTMLVAAAAQSWSVDPGSCRAEKGTVIHPATGRKVTYGEVAERAAKLPVPDKVALKDPKDFTLIGTPAKRLDTPSKVNGTAQFGIDVRLPGMKIATVAASPVLGGKVAGLDEQKAMAIKGVHQVVRLDDVVAVVADHMWAAKQGLAALAIRWDDGPNGKISTADVVKGLEEASRKQGVVARNEGDALSAIGQPARKIEAVYQAPFLAHAAMEPLSCTVHVRKDSCEVWAGSQVQGRARATAAEVTGLPLEKVVFHNYLLGGGFGRRLEHDYVTQAVRIAKQVEGPVKIVWTREEDVQHDVYRPYYYDRIAAGLDARGKLVDLDPPDRRVLHPRPLGTSRIQERARWRRGGRLGAFALRHPGHPGRVRAPRGAGAPHRLVARRGRHPQLLRDRELHRRARRRVEAGSGRVPPRPARASRRGPGRCSTSRRRRPAGESRCLPATDAAWP